MTRPADPGGNRSARAAARAQRASVSSASPLRVLPFGSGSDAPALALNADTYVIGDIVAYVMWDREILVLGKPV